MPNLHPHKPTLLEYHMDNVSAITSPDSIDHRLYIYEGDYSICLHGKVTSDTVSFTVPPIANLLSAGDKRYVLETTVDHRKYESNRGTLTVQPLLSTVPIDTNIKLSDTNLHETIAKLGSLPNDAIIGGSAYHLQERHGMYGKYTNASGIKWVAYDPEHEVALTFDDILTEADHVGNDQFNKMKQDILNRTIGPVVEASVGGLADNQPLECKVDTGASYCSLDAQDVHISQDSFDQEHELVFFTFRGVKYRAMIDQYQVVKTADGTSTRPAVVFNVTCNGTLVENVLFNLDDRSDMDYDVLLGLNFLDRSNFLIDPSKALHENITIELLDAAFQSILESNQIV